MAIAYVGDIGTTISLDCEFNVTAAIARTIYVKKPNNTITSFVADADGITAIRTAAVLFDMAGTWILWANVLLPSGQWSGAAAFLTVLTPGM